jgi:hypothetical protein
MRNLENLVAELVQELLRYGYDEKDIIWILIQYGYTDKQIKMNFGLPYDSDKDGNE